MILKTLDKLNALLYIIRVRCVAPRYILIKGESMKESNKKMTRKVVKILLQVCYDILIGVVVYIICSHI